jgi:hypothetical protein
MTRYIVGDEEAAALAAQGRDVEQVSDPLRSALAQPSAVLVLPARDGEHAFIATLRSSTAREAEEIGKGRKVAAYEATGFLGLEDSVVYEEPEAQKPWWKRLLRS